MEIWTGFTIGLLGGFHCIGMCGPLAMAIPLNRNNLFQKWTGFFLYNFGRILMYTLLGVIFGLIGGAFKINELQQILSVILGLGIIVSVVFPLFARKTVGGAKFIGLGVGKLKNVLGNKLRSKSFGATTMVGMLNGLLPCGLVYIGLTVATSTGSAMAGGVYMLTFGLGTVPLMLTVQWIGTVIKTNARNKIRKVIPVFVVVLGVMMVLRGLNLGIPYLSPQLEVKKGHVKACH